MKINGKEVGFRFTVGARQEIAALCPGQKWENFFDMFQGEEGKIVKNMYEVAHILNSYYEANRKHAGGEPVDPEADHSILERFDVYNMTDDEFVELDHTVVSTIFGDAILSVLAEPKKDDEGKKTAKSGGRSSTTKAGSSSTEE